MISVNYISIQSGNQNILSLDQNNSKIEEEIYNSDKRNTRAPPDWMGEKRLTNSIAEDNYPKMAVWGDNVHVVWREEEDDSNEIYYKRSLDNGQTWSSNHKLKSSGEMAYSLKIAVWQDNIHVTWSQLSVYYIRSTDNGQTWSAITVFDETTYPNSQMIHSPDVTVWENNVYLSVTAYMDSIPEYNLIFKRSSDNGSSWSDWILVTEVSVYYAIWSLIETDGTMIYIVFWWGTGSGQHLEQIESNDGGDTWVNQHCIYYADPGQTGFLWEFATSMMDSTLHIAYDVQFENIGIYSTMHGKIREPHISDEEITIDVSKDNVFWDEGDSENYRQIYSRKFGQITNSQSNSESHSIAVSGEITHIIWSDDRDGNNEIYYTQRRWRPELAISDSDIQFSPHNPIELGESLSINARVHNYGNSTENVAVKFFNGNPDLNNDLIPDLDAEVIGNYTVNIGTYSSINISLNWIPPAKKIYNIFVWINPAKLIQELNYSNNLASPKDSIVIHHLIDRFENFNKVELLDNCGLYEGDINLSYDENATEWEYEYSADIEPDEDGWQLSENAQTDLANAEGGLLALNTTSEDAYWVYNYYWSASNSVGVTLEAKFKVEDIGPNSDLFIFVRDGTYYKGINIFENKIQGLDDPSMIFHLDTTEDFHIYRITAKDNDIMVYIDGILCINGTDKFGSSTSGNVVQFGETSDSAGYYSSSLWDYVRFNTTGILEPGHFSEGIYTSIEVELPEDNKWDELLIYKTEAPGNYINITLIDGVSGIPIPGFENLSENSINISSIDPITHPSIKLVGYFKGTVEETPLLHSWALNFTPSTPPLFLSEGWNLISLPLIQSDAEIQAVLQSIEGDYNAIQVYQKSDSLDPWKHYHILKPTDFNDLFELDHTSGYFIHISKQGGITFNPSGIKPSFPQHIPLYSGWNLVGYPSLTNKNRTQALNNLSFGIHVDAVWTYSASTQQWEELGDFDYFKLGRGYWIHAKENCIWEVPL